MRLREQELRNLFCVINDLRMASLAKLAPSLVRLPSVYFKEFCLKFDLRYSNAFEGHSYLGFHSFNTQKKILFWQTLKGKDELQTFKISIFDTVR